MTKKTSRYILKTVMLLCCLLFCISKTIADETISNKSSGYLRYINAAKKLTKEEKYLEAESILSIAIKKYQSEAELYYQRAKLRQERLKNHNGAIADYSKIIKINKKSFPKSYQHRAEIYYNLGQYQLAINDCTASLALLPRYEKSYLLRAKSLAKLGRTAESMKDLKLTVKFSPKYAPSVNLLREKILSGNSDF